MFSKNKSVSYSTTVQTASLVVLTKRPVYRSNCYNLSYMLYDVVHGDSRTQRLSANFHLNTETRPTVASILYIADSADSRSVESRIFSTVFNNVAYTAKCTSMPAYCLSGEFFLVPFKGIH